MKSRIASLALLATSVGASLGLTATADAKDTTARPMFAVYPMALQPANPNETPSKALTVWSGSFTDQTSRKITFKMVGTDPTSTDTTTTVQVVVIPVSFQYSATYGNKLFDPTVDTIGAKSVINFMKSSPIFKAADFKSGTVDVGTTQYIDAFQRGNFWSTVQGEPDYHVLLKIKTVMPTLVITVPDNLGSVITNPWGTIPTGQYDFNHMNSAILAYLNSHTKQIKPNMFPLFISDDVYLTSGGCCIGGYHSARSGTQTFGYTTMVTESGDFSEDISALSHEVGEWLDDPFTNNHVNCNDNSILEVGDPLETLSQFGTFPFKVGKTTYHPQDLVFIGYFGYPTPYPSVNGWLSFDNKEHGVCPGQ